MEATYTTAVLAGTKKPWRDVSSAKGTVAAFSCTAVLSDLPAFHLCFSSW